MGRARIAILASVVAGLAGGVALARSAAPEAYYSGRFIDRAHRGAMSFRGTRKHDRVTRVLRFSWSNVPIVCHQGRFHLTPDHFRFAMRVSRSHNPARDRSFGASARAHTGAGSTGRFRWSVAGRFNPAFTTAHGTFRAWGDYSSRATACDTGTLRWAAK